MFNVALKKSAQKSLDAVPKQVQKHIVHAINELADVGSRASHTKKLHEPLGGYRKRVGDYRILFDIQDEYIVIHRITKRADAYR